MDLPTFKSKTQRDTYSLPLGRRRVFHWLIRNSSFSYVLTRATICEYNTNLPLHSTSRGSLNCRVNACRTRSSILPRQSKNSFLRSPRKASPRRPMSARSWPSIKLRELCRQTLGLATTSSPVVTTMRTTVARRPFTRSSMSGVCSSLKMASRFVLSLENVTPWH